MNRRRIVKALLWLVALTLIIVVVVSIPLADTMDALRNLTWQKALVLVSVNLCILALLNARWWVILRGYGHNLPFTALLGYRLATFGVSYFTPGPHVGGEPLQVLLVEKGHNTPRSTAIAAMTLDKSLELLVNFLFLLAGVALIVQQRLLVGTAGVAAITAVSLLVLLPGSYLFMIANGRSPLAGLAANLHLATARHSARSWHRRLGQAAATGRESEREIGRFLKQAPSALLAAGVLSLGAWLLMIAEFWLMINFLGASLSIVELVTVLTAARLAILLFLPAGLGALEVSQALAFGSIGLNPALGIGASLLIRARDVILGGLGLWWGSRKVSANFLSAETHGGQSP